MDVYDRPKLPNAAERTEFSPDPSLAGNLRRANEIRRFLPRKLRDIRRRMTSVLVTHAHTPTKSSRHRHFYRTSYGDPFAHPALIVRLDQGALDL
jgi:hypothetical protein